MAVSIQDKVITLTEEDDAVALPLTIKSIVWREATTAGHLLAIAQSDTLGDNTKVIYQDVAPGANYLSHRLIELHFPFGIEITDLDSGEVDIYLR